jgi:hypothetical protein
VQPLQSAAIAVIKGSYQHVLDVLVTLFTGNMAIHGATDDLVLDNRVSPARRRLLTQRDMLRDALK